MSLNLVTGDDRVVMIVIALGLPVLLAPAGLQVFALVVLGVLVTVVSVHTRLGPARRDT